MKKAGAGPARWCATLSGMEWFDPKILQKGLWILAFVVAWNFVLGLIEGVRSRRRPGWDQIWSEPIYKRVLRRGKGTITVESRRVD